MKAFNNSISNNIFSSNHATINKSSNLILIYDRKRRASI